jgi:hypothetical protein
MARLERTGPSHRLALINPPLSHYPGILTAHSFVRLLPHPPGTPSPSRHPFTLPAS